MISASYVAHRSAVQTVTEPPRILEMAEARIIVEEPQPENSVVAWHQL